MAIRTSLISFGLLAALGLWSNAPAQAAEVTILVNQGAVSGVRDLAKFMTSAEAAPLLRKSGMEPPAR